MPRAVRNLFILTLGVCPLLFFTDLTRNPYYTQIALFNVLIPACWLLWLIQAFKEESFVWVSTPLDLPLLSLIGISLVSWGASMLAHPRFITPIYSEGSKAAVFLIVNVFMVYAAALRLRDVSLLRSFLWVTYAVSFLAAAYGVCQYFGVELIWSTTLNPYGFRPVSTFGNPNFMSSYLVVVIPVMAVDYLYKVTGFPRALLFIVMQMSLAALLCTLTRSSWVGLGVAMLFVFWGAREKVFPGAKGKALLAVTFILLTLAWPKGGTQRGYSPTVVERLTEVKKVRHEAYGSAYQRFLIWLAAWGMMEDHPFIGKGWGCFELFYPFYQGPLLLQKNLSARTHANNAHNEVMEYGSQVGLLGLGIAVWLWVVFFRTGVSRVGRLSGPWKPMMWGMMGGVAGMLVDNLLNVSIYFCMPAFIFWWMVGNAMALDPTGVRSTPLDTRAPWKKGILVLLGIALIALMVRAFCFWQGEIQFFRGFKMSKAGVDLLSASRHLEKAHAWHPLEVNNNYELGNVYARMGDKEKALSMYQRAIDANGGYDEIYFNRATMLMQMGHLEEAVANYRLVLAINPLSHEVYNALASLYFKDVERYAPAIESLYTLAVQVFPKDRDMWNNLGYLYTQRQEWQKAADAYTMAITADPHFELAQRNLAVVQEKLRKASGVSKR